MKLKTLIFIFSIGIVFPYMLNAQENDKDFSLAKSGKRIYGVYMFVYAEPYYNYDYIATIRLSRNEIGFSEGNLQRIVNKAKRKYSYFNGMIFKNDEFTEVDLIKFKNLEVSRGGFTIGDNVSFIIEDEIYFGKVVEFDSENSKAQIRYFNIFDEDLIKPIYYNKLTPISDEDFKIKTDEFKIEILKYKFKNGEKVSWIKNNETHLGQIISINNEKHRAKVKTVNIYDEEEISTIKFLKLIKISEEDYYTQMEPFRKEILKYKFVVGEKIIWIIYNDSEIGEIISLNTSMRLASIKHLNKYGEDKIKSVKFLDLIKMSEEEYIKRLNTKKLEVEKHKFQIGDRVKWVKKGTEGKNQIQYIGEIIELKDGVHKAIIKYTNEKSEKQTDNINYLKLLKIE